MTPAGDILADEMARTGAVPLDRFIEVALYHPEHGYYRRPAERFGTGGDFYTAEQLQPVFGILIAAAMRGLRDALGLKASEFTVVELGAGRREMAPAFAAFNYVPLDAAYGELPSRFTGAVFANEFFDALPVRAFEWRAGEWREALVGFNGERFVWVEGGPAVGEAHEMLDGSPLAGQEGARQEVCPAARRWFERVDGAMERGFIVAIDYGYTTRELIRFSEGTLMSYLRHRALDDVLAMPGERDITSHVNFSALVGAGEALGWQMVRLESLAQLLLRAGEADEFAAALGEGLARGDDAGAMSRRLQLKTLLFSMGESFRALTMEKRPPGRER
jgi:SAM-dependent MidA family methyltransferase